MSLAGRLPGSPLQAPPDGWTISLMSEVLQTGPARANAYWGSVAAHIAEALATDAATRFPPGHDFAGSFVDVAAPLLGRSKGSNPHFVHTAVILDSVNIASGGPSHVDKRIALLAMRTGNATNLDKRSGLRRYMFSSTAGQVCWRCTSGDIDDVPHLLFSCAGDTGRPVADPARDPDCSVIALRRAGMWAALEQRLADYDPDADVWGAIQSLSPVPRAAYLLGGLARKIADASAEAGCVLSAAHIRALTRLHSDVRMGISGALASFAAAAFNLAPKMAG